jgi:hypothetical protein
MTTVIPNAAQSYATKLRELAGQVRHLMKDSQRAEMIEQIARDISDFPTSDEDLLLTEPQAVAYTRGYTAEYLARAVTNRGTVSTRLYRKGDLPRRLVQRPEKQKRGATGLIEAFGDVD